MDEESKRLQVYLSERGVSSRRGAAELVRSGRVSVNGELVREPGLRVRMGFDRVSVDGRELFAERVGPRTLALYKPRGYVCSRSTREGRSIYALLEGVAERVNSAGRLDMDSEGLLVLSNDGALLNRLMHPRYGHEKVYEVTVDGVVDAGVLARLEGLRDLDDERLEPVQVEWLRNRAGRSDRNVLEFRLCEGKNRQIRRMCEKVGLSVRRLMRVKIGGLGLDGLRPGAWRELSLSEIQKLLE